MQSINRNHHLHRNGLGSFTDIFSAGAGLIDSFVDARSDRKSDESDERQLQLQLQAQKELAQMESARFNQILKITMIAGGVLLTGAIVITILKSDTKTTNAEKNIGNNKQRNLGTLEVRDRLKKMNRRTARSPRRKVA